MQIHDWSNHGISRFDYENEKVTAIDLMKWCWWNFLHWWVRSFIGKFDLLIPLKPSQSSNPSECIISLSTRKSRKGTNSSYRVVFVFTMKSRHVWKAIVQRVKIGQKLREFRFVFCLTFSLSSRHSLYIFGFLYCCIKAKTKLDAEVTKAGLLEQTTYRPMLGNQKGVGFWTPRCGFRSACQWNFDSWFQSLVGSGGGGGGG